MKKIGAAVVDILSVPEFKQSSKVVSELEQGYRSIEKEKNEMKEYMGEIIWQNVVESRAYPPQLDNAIATLSESQSAIGQRRINLLRSVQEDMITVWAYTREIFPRKAQDPLDTFQSSVSSLFDAMKQQGVASSMAVEMVTPLLYDFLLALRSRVFDCIDVVTQLYFLLWDETVKEGAYEDRELRHASTSDGMLLIFLTTRLTMFTEKTVSEDVHAKHVKQIGVLFGNRLLRYHTLLYQTQTDFDAMIKKNSLKMIFNESYWYDAASSQNVFHKTRTYIITLSTTLKTSPAFSVYWLANLAPYGGIISSAFSEYFYEMGKELTMAAAKENTLPEVVGNAKKLQEAFPESETESLKEGIELAESVEDSLSQYFLEHAYTKRHEIDLISEGSELLASWIVLNTVDEQKLNDWYSEMLGVEDIASYFNYLSSVTRLVEYESLLLFPKIPNLHEMDLVGNDGLEKRLKKLKKENETILRDMERLEMVIADLSARHNYFESLTSLKAYVEGFAAIMAATLQKDKEKRSLDDPDITKMLYKAARQLEDEIDDKKLREFATEWAYLSLKYHDNLVKQSELEESKVEYFKRTGRWVRAATVFAVCTGAAIGLGYMAYSYMTATPPPVEEVIEPGWLGSVWGYVKGTAASGLDALNTVKEVGTDIALGTGVSVDGLKGEKLKKAVIGFLLSGTGITGSLFHRRIMAYVRPAERTIRFGSLVVQGIWEISTLTSSMFLVPIMSRWDISPSEAYEYQAEEFQRRMTEILLTAKDRLQEELAENDVKSIAQGKAIVSTVVAAYTGGATAALATGARQFGALLTGSTAPQALPSNEQMEVLNNNNDPQEALVPYKNQRRDVYDELRDKYENTKDRRNQKQITVSRGQRRRLPPPSAYIVQEVVTDEEEEEEEEE